MPKYMWKDYCIAERETVVEADSLEEAKSKLKDGNYVEDGNYEYVADSSWEPVWCDEDGNELSED